MVDLCSQSIMEVIRNYPNQVFREQGDYDAFHRALLREDVRFLREDFTGDVDRVCLALQQYVDVFRVREIAEEPLREHLETLLQAGVDIGNMENERLVPEQRATLEVVEKAWRLRFDDQRVKRTELLCLMYTNPRDEDEDDYNYGTGVNEPDNNTYANR